MGIILIKSNTYVICMLLYIGEYQWQSYDFLVMNCNGIQLLQ
jgi:hypothetical protein